MTGTKERFRAITFDVTEDQWAELARRVARDGFASVEDYARHRTLGLDRLP
jgi:hypothetical protein